MRVKLFLLLILLSGIRVFGQMQDLEKLAEGRLVYSSILYDSTDKVYGYFYLFQRDKDKVYKNMEYVFLDKNLNKTSNNTFKCYSYNESNLEGIGIKSEYIDCTLMGDYVILSKLFYYYTAIGGVFTPITNSLQIISLKDKTVTAEMKYDNGIFVELPADGGQLKKEAKKKETKDIVTAFQNGNNKGFFISQYSRYDDEKLTKELKLFDEDKKLKWNYVYNPNGSRKEYRTCRILHTKNNNIYLLEGLYKSGNPSEYHIVCLDFNTGEKKYDYLFENEKSAYNHTIRCREVNGKLALAGNYSKATKSKDFDLEKNLGFYKITLDPAGNELEHQYSKWSDFKGALDVDENGRVEKNFRLRPTRFFFFENGTISILNEKYKPQSSGVFIPIPIVGSIVQAATMAGERSTDFVLFNMNKDFASNNIKTIKKQFSESYSGGAYDFLFSQYINNDNDAVFFYKDFVKKDNKEQKEDQWILGINTIINGELAEEKIPISAKKKYVIEPLPAKEGYILLREFNKEDKYNQVRLEKLNY